MKILLVFFLAALVGCYGDESECVERAGRCWYAFREAVPHGTRGTLPYKFCRETDKAIECTEKAVESYCAGHKLEDEIKSFIERRTAHKIEFCEKNRKVVSFDADTQKCFEENEASITPECMAETMEKVLAASEAMRNAGDHENRRKCSLYMLAGECFLKRFEEKCGAEAAKELGTILSDAPDDVKEACESVGISLSAGDLNEDNKKK